MKVIRKTEIETNSFIVGDQMAVGHYTATCQKVSEEGALFFMDQYDDEARPMNENGSNEGGYEESDLRKYLQSDEGLYDFRLSHLIGRLVPFENGDLIRIPTVEELFGEKECDYDDGSLWVEHLGGEQLPLMVSRANRVAYRENKYEWGWLQNKKVTSAAFFAAVDLDGFACYGSAQYVRGVRRVFQIKKKCD